MMNLKRPTPRHIIFKMLKVKLRILKAARKRQLHAYKRLPIRLTADFSAETLQARRERQDIFKMQRGKNYTTEKTVWQGYDSELRKR